MALDESLELTGNWTIAVAVICAYGSLLDDEEEEVVVVVAERTTALLNVELELRLLDLVGVLLPLAVSLLLLVADTSFMSFGNVLELA